MQYMPMTNKSENTDKQRKEIKKKPTYNLAHPKTTSVNTLNTLTTSFCRRQCAELEPRLCVWWRGRGTRRQSWHFGLCLGGSDKKSL